MSRLLNERKSIPIGIENFKDIRVKDWFYVDKTALISDIIKTSSASVKLITRPRRFGKTLNLSMLKYFFDIEGAERNRELFNGLEIENTPYMEHFGSYPVISLTLKALKNTDFKGMHMSMRQLMADVFNNYKFLPENGQMSDAEISRFNKVLYVEEPDIERTLLFLCSLLYRNYGKKVIVLMDEYDSPVISSYVKGYHEEVIDFFRNFMSNTFKTNDYLETGIITGVSRISRESIFSDMNNVTVYSVLSGTFSERFGFTSDEVAEILDTYGYSDKKDAVKRYYDGYRFGEEGVSETDIYNPLAILKYADSGKLHPYWVNTASDDLIKNVAVKDLQRFLEVSEELLQGGSVPAIINDGMTFKGLDSVDSLWTLLLYSGYVTVAAHKMEDLYFLRLTNEEITSYFRNLIREIYSTKVQTPENFAELLFLDREKFYDKLNQRLAHFSYFDLTSEKDYHLFLTCALLMNMDVGKDRTYEVLSNRESGKGRPDIMIIDKQNNRAVIFEIKHVKKADCLTEELKQEKIASALKSAGRQMTENKYGLDFSVEIQHVPLVGCGKAFYYADRRIINHEPHEKHEQRI